MQKIYADIWDSFWLIRDVMKKVTDFGLNHPETIAAIFTVRPSIGGIGKDALEAVYKSIHQEWSDMRNRIVAQYYYLVQNTAANVHKKNNNVEEHVLASMGVDGIYDAVDGYGDINPETGRWDGIDPNKKTPVKFETYCVYRIKGAILDQIRREDWVPRLVRSRAKKIEEKKKELEVHLGRLPTSAEMAEELKISVKEYDKWVDTSSLKTIQSLNSAFTGREGDFASNEEMSMMDCIHDPATPEPLDVMVQEELKSKLFGKNFSPIERKIIYSYFYENRSMKEISEGVNLSESRISQMMSAIIERLREKILRNPEYFGPSIVEMIKSYMRSQEGSKKKRVESKGLPPKALPIQEV